MVLRGPNMTSNNSSNNVLRQLGSAVMKKAFGAAEPKGTVFSGDIVHQFGYPMTGADLKWLIDRYDVIKSSRRSNQYVKKKRADIISELATLYDDLHDPNLPLTFEQISTLSEKVLLRREKNIDSWDDPQAAADLITNELSARLRKSAEYYYYLPANANDKTLHEKYQQIVINLDEFPDKIKPLTVGDLRLYFRVLRKYELQLGDVYRQSLKDMFNFIIYNYGTVSDKKVQDTQELSSHDLKMLSRVMLSRRQRNNKNYQDPRSFESRFFNYLSEHARHHLKRLFDRDMRAEQAGTLKVDTRSYQAIHTRLFELPDTQRFLTLRDLLRYMNYYCEHRGFFRKVFDKIIGLSPAMQVYQTVLEDIAENLSIKPEELSVNSNNAKFDEKLSDDNLRKISDYLQQARKTSGRGNRATQKTLTFIAEHVAKTLQGKQMNAQDRASMIEAATGLPDNSKSLTVADMKKYLQLFVGLKEKSLLADISNTVGDLQKIVKSFHQANRQGTDVLTDDDMEYINAFLKNHGHIANGKTKSKYHKTITHLRTHAAAKYHQESREQIKERLSKLPHYTGKAYAFITDKDVNHYYLVLPDAEIDHNNRAAYRELVVDQGAIAAELLSSYEEAELAPTKLVTASAVDKQAEMLVQQHLPADFDLGIARDVFMQAARNKFNEDDFIKAWGKNDNYLEHFSTVGLFKFICKLLKDYVGFRHQGIVSKALETVDAIYLEKNCEHNQVSPDYKYVENLIACVNESLKSEPKLKNLDKINLDTLLKNADPQVAYDYYLGSAWQQYSDGLAQQVYTNLLKQLVSQYRSEQINTGKDEGIVNKTLNKAWQRAILDAQLKGPANEQPELKSIKTRNHHYRISKFSDLTAAQNIKAGQLIHFNTYLRSITQFAKALFTDKDFENKRSAAILMQHEYQLFLDAYLNKNFTMVEKIGLSSADFMQEVEKHYAEADQKQAGNEISNMFIYAVYRKLKADWRAKNYQQQYTEKYATLKEELVAQGALDEIHIYADEEADVSQAMISLLSHYTKSGVIQQALDDYEAAVDDISSFENVKAVIKEINALHGKIAEENNRAMSTLPSFKTLQYHAYLKIRVNKQSDYLVEPNRDEDERPVCSLSYAVAGKQMVKGEFPRQLEEHLTDPTYRLYKCEHNSMTHEIFREAAHDIYGKYTCMPFTVNIEKMVPQQQNIVNL